LVAFLLLSFSFIWDFFFVAGPVPALFWVSVVLAVAAAAVMARRWRSARAMQLEAAGILVVVIASAWSMAIAASPGSPSVPPEALGYDGFVPVGGGGFSYPILFNVLLAAAILGAVLVGLATNRNAFVNTGLVFFGLLVLARYFDFSFTLFDRSVVFIGAGILLLVTSYGLARLQRRLVRRVPEGNGP
jgi:hypothetical protein